MPHISPNSSQEPFPKIAGKGTKLSHGILEVRLQPVQHEVILHGFQEVTLEPQEISPVVIEL